MDSYDPQRKVGLIWDEWGTWHPPAEGHHPRHLWQQNTMRDALVAATTLDIFNRHADKVIMSNIAQTINVLQAMILTDGDRMLKTPTYHVYDMYKVHQDATSILTGFDCDDISFNMKGSEYTVPALSGSASIKGDILTLNVVNLHADTPIEANIDIKGAMVKEATLQTLSYDDIHAHNTFEAPDEVAPQSSTVTVSDKNWTFTFQPASVNVFKIRI
jgi:alpha-N-arabinofuranosidase